MKEFIIKENDANQRLDKFLKKLLFGASSSLIYKFNRKNKVKINGKKEDNEYKIQLGDKINIYLNDEEFDLLTKKEKENNSLKANNFNKKDIIYEDSYLIVMNKNPGINVHPGDYKTKELSLISQVQDYLGNKLNSLTFKPSLVHRLDRDTSGIVIIAKKKDILTKLVKDFKTHNKIKKTYIAFVKGKLPYNNGYIDKKIKRIENAKNEDKVILDKNGKDAFTKYKVLGEYFLETKNGKEIISEVEIEIKTGRMHQIRIHLSSIGNPVLGDKKYGDLKFNSFLEKNFFLKRQLLHASKISFFHYGRDKIQTLEARLKEDSIQFKKNLIKK